MVVYANSSDMIHIGRVGENKATTVAFDVTDWIEEFGEGNFNLLVEKDSKIYPRTIFEPFREGYEIFTLFFPEDFPRHIRYYYNSKTKPGYSFYFDACVKGIEKDGNYTASIKLFDAENYNKVKIVDSQGNIYYQPITYVFGNNNFLEEKDFEEKEIINGVETTVEYNFIPNIVPENDFKELPVEKNEGLVLWEIEDIDTKEAGIGKCMLDYRINDIVVKSRIYAYIVTNSIGDSETTEPEEYNWVELILDKANYIEDNIEGSHISAVEAEAWAVGKKNGKSVTKDEEQYNNNAKYYSEQSKLSSNSAARSANSAEDSKQTARLWAVGNKTFEKEDINDDGTLTEIIDFETNNAEYFCKQALQEKVDAESWAIEAENFKNEAMAIAFGGQDAAEVVQGLINEGMSKSVTIYNWTSALLS